MKMEKPRKMTPQRAKVLADVSAKVMQVLMNAKHEHAGVLDVGDLLIGATVSMRGIAAMFKADNPGLTSEDIKRMTMVYFSWGMSLPDGIVTAHQGPEDDHGPGTAAVIPLRGEQH
jgi:hypothetical protein